MVNHTIQKLALISLLSLSVSAFAAEKQGSYGGIELGYLGLQNEAQDSANALVRAFGGSASVTSDSGMAVGRLFGGYNFNENIGIELGAYRTSDFDQTANLLISISTPKFFVFLVASIMFSSNTSKQTYLSNLFL